jgi:hypothetical protein
VRRRDGSKPYEPIIRGPLRLHRRWSSEPPPPPVRTVEEEVVRLLQTAARINERARLKADPQALYDQAEGFPPPPRAK